MQDIEIARPSANKTVIITIGIAQKIWKEIGNPRIERSIAKITRVGRNLKIATTVAEMGNIILGNAVLRMRR